MSKKAGFLMREKLTKTFFMRLPENVYLVSNLHEDKDTPGRVVKSGF
jgi:hypothetical protein